jgi:predicted HTH transcriptional regulator
MQQDFENLPAPEQDLSFAMINGLVDRILGRSERIEGRVRDDGAYNNYALMVSDQCPWHLVLRMEDRDMVFSGPLPIQAKDFLEHMNFIKKTVKVKMLVGVFSRFPMVAVKEMAVNAVIHFDPSMKEDIVITMKDDQLVFRSPGGIYYNDGGLPVLRNPRLADLMKRLGYATLTGYGLIKTKGYYNRSGLVPCIVRDDRSFTVCLPALDTAVSNTDTGADIVLQYVNEHGGATMGDISAKLMLSKHQACLYIDELVAAGKIVKMGT